MFRKRQTIIISKAGNTLEEMCHDILKQAGGEGLLKIVFFCNAANDSEYLQVLGILRSTVESFFVTERPLVSYIAHLLRVQLSKA